MPLNSVMRSSPPLPLVTGHGHDIRWGQVVRGAPVIQPSLPGVTHSDHTGEGRQRTTQGQWSNNSISIVCRPGRAASFGGELGQRGVRDITQLRLCSILQSAAVTHAAVTSLRTVETRETKFSFFRHFYKINLLFRCI